MAKRKVYTCACIGEFVQAGCNGDIVYALTVTSPFKYDTPELAKNDVGVIKFQKVNGHIVLVVHSDNGCQLRDGKTNVITWDNWMQYRMACVDAHTGEERPCSDNWDELFGVDNVNDDFEQIVDITGVNVFSYENM